MMREIVFDTETTGLDWRDERIIELGGIELVNRFPTGRSFHRYINPQGRQINAEAQAVHGISAADLVDKPIFGDIAEEFIAFINAELDRIGQPGVDQGRVVDTLAIAKRKHPMGPNSLDALCRRYGIDNSHRTKHGALLDSELLAEVYIELIGGKQAALGLDSIASGAASIEVSAVEIGIRQRPAPLAPRITEAEIVAHALLVGELGEKAIWLRM